MVSHRERSALRACAGLMVWSLVVVTALMAPARGSVTDGPRPRAPVIDTTHTLAAEDVEQLERLAAGIRAASGADLMVVVIPSTNGQPHRRFATDLFNRWQVGSAERNDGLLVFVAIDDRKAEIILGDGIDAPAQVAASERIMQKVMVPEFRRGSPAAAIRKGTLACAADILGAAPERPPATLPEREAPVEVPPRPPPADVPAQTPPADVPAETSAADAAEQQDRERVVQPVVPAEAFPAPVPPGPAWIEQPRQPDPGPGLLPAFLVGSGLFGGTGAGWYLLRRRLRTAPRTCPMCRIDMVRLSEEADDAHLSPGEAVEERLRSVNYDVWTCPTCPFVTTVRYGAFFTWYARCPSCHFVTTSATVNRVKSPTKWSSGLEEIRQNCAHCGHTHLSTRVIPREVDDSSSMWSSSSTSGSFSSSSSGSGGGSSSGAGASGSW